MIGLAFPSAAATRAKSWTVASLFEAVGVAGAHEADQAMLGEFSIQIDQRVGKVGGEGHVLVGKSVEVAVEHERVVM